MTPNDRDVASAAPTGHDDLTDVVERLTRQLAQQSLRDPLTGLPNRLQLVDRLRAVAADGVAGVDVALLHADLDRFKDVNDAYGHAAGDQVLVQFAERLRGVCRNDDLVVRLGGDEFAVLLGAADGGSRLRLLAEQVVRLAAQPYEVTDVAGVARQVVIGASIGTSAAVGDVGEPLVEPCPTARRAGDGALELLLKQADLAMYQAKATGRGRVQGFEEARRAVEAAELARRSHNTVERRLRAAVDQGSLELVYQPVVQLPQGRTVCLEALARWHDPDLGHVAPDRFVHVAEASGLIHDLGRWALATACRDASAWTVDDDDAVPTVAVNVSPLQLEDAGFAEVVLDALASTGLPGQRLCLEITESADVSDTATAVRSLQRLRDAGVVVALDDFGTGHSSITMLRHLPLDIVKIDRSFTASIDRSAADAVVFRMLVDAAHSLGLQVVAEGVEDTHQLRRVARLGVDRVQGWHLGRPGPVAEVAGRAVRVPQVAREIDSDEEATAGDRPDEFVVGFRDGVIRYVSSSVHRVLGLLPAQLLGTRADTWVHPKDLAEVRQVLDAAAAAGVPYEGADVRVRDRSGAGRWVRARADVPREGADPISLVWFCRDVTDLVEAERSRRAAEETFEQVFLSAPVGMGLSDLDGCLVAVNPAFAAMLGRTVEDLLGRTVESITHPDDVETDRANLGLQRESGHSVVVRKRYLHASGTPVPVEVRTSVATDGRGLPARVVAYVSPLAD